MICIGREFGSGGRKIGKILADGLSLLLYDQALVTEAMKKCVVCRTMCRFYS